jgi:hypothetical protein
MIAAVMAGSAVTIAAMWSRAGSKLGLHRVFRALAPAPGRSGQHPSDDVPIDWELLGGQRGGQVIAAEANAGSSTMTQKSL